LQTQKNSHMSNKSDKKAEEFLSISSQFKLGSLITEASNPITKDLSSLAKNNLPKAISSLKQLDDDTIKVLVESKTQIYYLKEKIKETLDSGSNVYFCGCGSTGRLSLTIETLWRQVHSNDDLKDRVFSFMSGGDVALIRSIENFEDYPQYGARQLVESGFKDGDLMVGSSEGGETAFVIGAVEKAAEISKRKQFFLYCNPDEILCEVAERSKSIIQNPKIEKIILNVGPMGVTGSTRMQSSTILLAAEGIALLYFQETNDTIGEVIDTFAEFWYSADIQFIEKYIAQEAGFYKNGDYLLYESDNKLGISIITDTTERAPTFSLHPFENVNEKEQKLSLCYLYMPDALSSEDAWKSLLWRDPRALEWSEIDGIASRKRLIGFDYSKNVLARRKLQDKSAQQHCFKIMSDKGGINFILEGENHFLATPFENPIFTHLVLKMILNTHSTIIMGILGRYEGNVMTYVKASNNKLIDRAVRYIDLLLKNKEISLPYDKLVHILYEMLEVTPDGESIVLATVQKIEKRYK
jgi:N-acetylmuramic acid 6-phosphate etherase